MINDLGLNKKNLLMYPWYMLKFGFSMCNIKFTWCLWRVLFRNWSKQQILAHKILSAVPMRYQKFTTVLSFQKPLSWRQSPSALRRSPRRRRHNRVSFVVEWALRVALPPPSWPPAPSQPWTPTIIPTEDRSSRLRIPRRLTTTTTTGTGGPTPMDTCIPATDTRWGP